MVGLPLVDSVGTGSVRDFRGLAVLGASVPVIFCVGFPVLVVSLFLLVILLLEEPLSMISNQLDEITRELKKR